MANLSGVVQQLRNELGLGAGCQRQHGQESRLPRERDGQRCGGMAGRNKMSSACPRGKACQLPLERKFPQHSGRDRRG